MCNIKALYTLVVTIIAACLLTSVSHAQVDRLIDEVQPVSTGEIKNYDSVLFNMNSLATEGGQYVWEESFSVEGSEFMRVKLSDISICAACQFKIEFKDSEYRTVETITQKELEGRSQIWSQIVDGDVIFVSLSMPSNVPSKKVSFNIDGVIGSIKEAAVKSHINDPPRLKPTYKMPSSKKALARSVAKVDYVKAGKNKTCTGFMIADSLLLTNHHCINDQNICADSTTFDFSHEAVDENGSKFNELKGRCLKIKQLDKKLDFALLEVFIEDSQIVQPLDLCSKELVNDQPLLSIQHPDGRLKEFTECTVDRVPVRGGRNVTELLDLSHNCDTENGSSGSPIFNSDGEVVGLHHLGKSLTLAGFKEINRAVQIKKILPVISNHGIANACL